MFWTLFRFIKTKKNIFFNTSSFSRSSTNPLILQSIVRTQTDVWRYTDRTANKLLRIKIKKKLPRSKYPLGFLLYNISKDLSRQKSLKNINLKTLQMRHTRFKRENTHNASRRRCKRRYTSLSHCPFARKLTTWKLRDRFYRESSQWICQDAYDGHY